ncbi:heparinase II/III family protein [Candidatus Sulfurimonas baltica]|uniref:Alginate lyase family protein n=1 Tax=Candidatus Sulfurimonas baltica TaxID=2740404 RepID=A0A7S7LWL5_9BACT|nr:heparinase II/III family protein [Candidatus Sulfurimonas baltica]QOY52687.1 alginate lyase family protein [Candidatus Sulfurimonas baltica]
MSAQELVKKVVNKINTKVKDSIQKSKDLNGNTHIGSDVHLIQTSYIDVKELDTSNIDIKVAIYLSQMYCEHKFDLLGSGWVENSYASVALGVEGYTYDMNMPAPKSISAEYEPIDWQKDYKSGYRWNETTWYKDQKIGHKLGSDIKVPWELARFQHLPQLAIFSIVDESLKEQNIKEFKYQILDFIVNNPPRMGVNWACTMDVGIRVANMLVAYDMFMQLDCFGVLDDEFKQTFANSIYGHGLHIVDNLEYSEFGRSNHYLSDISGLLFVSAYMESNDEINQWLAFSIQEVINEMDYEFYEDGGNFESSTSYHRLSGELMVYCTALILGLKEEKVKALQNYSIKGWKVKPKLLPLDKQEFKINNSISKIELQQWYIDRLYKIGRFTVDITKQNGDIPQFGDNDSGRFFRFSPNGKFLTNKEAVDKYLNLKGYVENDELFWDENILNHSTFVSCFGGAYEDAIFNNDMAFEKSFINAIAEQKFEQKDIPYKNIKKNSYSLDGLNHENTIIHNSKLNIINSKLITYPDSGIFIFKADDFYLAVCVTPLGQKNSGGHTHNDKLGYELWLDGKDIVKDPGTYLYTPLSHRRNEFRSIIAHNVPIVENIEQNSWNQGNIGLFCLFNESKCFVKNFGSNFIELVLEYKDIKIVRRFEINEKKVQVIDKCNRVFYKNKFGMYSNGYGKVENV